MIETEIKPDLLINLYAGAIKRVRCRQSDEPDSPDRPLDAMCNGLILTERLAKSNGAMRVKATCSQCDYVQYVEHRFGQRARTFDPQLSSTSPSPAPVRKTPKPAPPAKFKPKIQPVTKKVKTMTTPPAAPAFIFVDTPPPPNERLFAAGQLSPLTLAIKALKPGQHLRVDTPEKRQRETLLGRMWSVRKRYDLPNLRAHSVDSGVAVVIYLAEGEE